MHNERTILGIILVIATLAYFAGVAWLFAMDFFPGSVRIQKPTPVSFPAKKAMQGIEPARLRIPAINVDAASQRVGLTPKGAIGIPTNYRDVAWFTGSPKPGVAGNAIIVGHRDTRVFAPGVFRRLKDLKVGDDVYVADADGSELHFKVVAKKTYNEDTDHLEEIVGKTSRTRLNLITCEGTWNQAVRRYNQRLVVFTELVQ